MFPKTKKKKNTFLNNLNGCVNEQIKLIILVEDR